MPPIQAWKHYVLLHARLWALLLPTLKSIISYEWGLLIEIFRRKSCDPIVKRFSWYILVDFLDVYKEAMSKAAKPTALVINEQSSLCKYWSRRYYFSVGRAFNGFIRVIHPDIIDNVDRCEGIFFGVWNSEHNTIELLYKTTCSLGEPEYRRVYYERNGTKTLHTCQIVEKTTIVNFLGLGSDNKKTERKYPLETSYCKQHRRIRKFKL